MTKQRISLKNSIATQLLKTIFGCYLILAVVVTAMQLIAEYDHIKKAILKDMGKLPITFGPGISTSVWRFNNTLLRSIVSGMCELPIVVGVSLEDNHGNDIVSMGSILNAKHKMIHYDKQGHLIPINKENTLFSDLFGHEFPVVYTAEDGTTHELGKGTIYSNNRIVIDRIEYGFFLILINSVIKTVGLWIISLFFLRKMLGKPIESLTDAVKRVDTKYIQPQEIDIQVSENNELKILAQSFNMMIDDIYQAHQSLDQVNQNLEKKVEERSSVIIETNNQLQKEITERRQAEKQIKAHLKEKEILLRELYHRTKNNMQIIIAMLHLQSQAIEDDNTLQIFKEMENGIKTMALVHEKLYQTKDLSRIDMKDYLNDLINLLMRSYKELSKGIRIKPDMESVFATIDSAIPCGLIINELISNSFKHAFPGDRKGKIRIGLKSKDDEMEILVADDGVGMPDGFVLRESDSLGLKTALNLTEHQLQGEFTLNMDKGTEFQIRFKDPSYKERI